MAACAIVVSLRANIAPNAVDSHPRQQTTGHKSPANKFVPSRQTRPCGIRSRQNQHGAERPMSNRFTYLRSLAGAAIGAALLWAPAARADETLIETTHADPTTGFLGPIDYADHSWAVSWTQTATLDDAEFRLVMLQRAISDPDAVWTLATAIGPDATAADILATGTLSHARPLPAVTGDQFDFTKDQLSFRYLHRLGPGTYYLVLSGVSGAPHDNAIWVGADGDSVGVNESAGFTLDDFYSTSDPDPFPLSGGPFGWRTTSLRFGFVMQGVRAAVPEPAAWALTLLGFGAAGAALRARRKAAAAA
jgi:hypothetical protein